jgi:O-antigen/teichoic acid export membrane protein
MGILLFNKTDILILGNFNYILEISYMQLFLKIFSIILLPFYIFAQIITPLYVEYSSHKKFSIIKNKIKKYLLSCTLIALFICTIYYLVLPVVIKHYLPLYHNVEFYKISNILIPNLFIAILVSIINSGMITATGDYKIITNNFIIFGIIKLLLNILIIIRIGVIPMIISSVVLLIIVNLKIIYEYYYKYKIKTKII